MLQCPNCQSHNFKKNGRIHNGKQRYWCKDCGRQFTPEGTKKMIGEETRAMVDRLLLEKLPLAGIARAVQVSETWLQEYVNAKYQAVQKQVKVPVKKGH
jgi:insertion element IS1 protein InsB